MEDLLEYTNFNPWMWVVIPISFVVGFFLHVIAYVLGKVEDAVDKVTLQGEVKCVWTGKVWMV